MISFNFLPLPADAERERIKFGILNTDKTVGNIRLKLSENLVHNPVGQCGTFTVAGTDRFT